MTANSAIFEYRNKVAEKIKEKVDCASEVKTHRGRFGQGELKKFMAKSRSVWVCVLAGQGLKINSDGRYSMSFDLAAFIVTKKSGQQSEDEQALKLAEAIIANIYDEQFSIAGVHVPEKIRFQNLHSQGEKSITLISSVSWKVSVLLGQKSDFDEGLEFEDDAEISVTGEDPDA